MRIAIDRLPSEKPCQPDELGWVPIGDSGGRRGYLWAIGAGLLALSCIFILIILFSLRVGGSGPAEPRAGDAFPWLAVLTAPLLSILAHEGLHLLWHPGHGRSDRSVVLFWPRYGWR